MFEYILLWQTREGASHPGIISKASARTNVRNRHLYRTQLAVNPGLCIGGSLLSLKPFPEHFQVFLNPCGGDSPAKGATPVGQGERKPVLWVGFGKQGCVTRKTRNQRRRRRAAQFDFNGKRSQVRSLLRRPKIKGLRSFSRGLVYCPLHHLPFDHYNAVNSVRLNNFDRICN